MPIYVCLFSYYIVMMSSLIQVDWRAEIEVHLSKIQQEGLSPLHGDNDLVEQREAELR